MRTFFSIADSDIDYRLINQAAEVKRGDLIVVSASSIALTSKELHCLEWCIRQSHNAFLGTSADAIGVLSDQVFT